MSKPNIQPLGNRVVIERKEAVLTKGGILLPESAKDKPAQGTVVAIGPGRTDEQGKTHPMDLKVGNEVLFINYAGTEYTSENTEYLLLSEEDVLATL